MNDLALKGKVAIVTGAGGGIGREIALALANEGVKILANDIGVSLSGEGGSIQPAEETCGLITQKGGAAITDTNSVTSWSSASKIIENALDNFKQIDIIVNNAGILRDVIFHKMDPKDWTDVIDVHLNGSFYISRAAAPFFREQNSGSFVHMTSTSGLIGNFGQANYSAAKAGVSAMTVLWAKELAKHGIRVAGVAPGFTATEMVVSLRDDVKEKFVKSIPLRRFADPSEMSDGVLFILKNEYFTGRMLEIDGGVRM